MSVRALEAAEPGAARHRSHAADCARDEPDVNDGPIARFSPPSMTGRFEARTAQGPKKGRLALEPPSKLKYAQYARIVRGLEHRTMTARQG
jgi:hypothetical protein